MHFHNKELVYFYFMQIKKKHTVGKEFNLKENKKRNKYDIKRLVNLHKITKI